MADITGRDSDGELIATPAEWDEEDNGAAPKIRIHVPAPPAAGHRRRRRRPRAAADREDRTTAKARSIAAASSRCSITPRPACSASSARCRDGGGRLVPVDKKQAGRELNIAPADTGGAEDGDLVSVDLVRSRGYGLASGKVKERLGSLATEKAVSLIAIHAHEIPQAFSPCRLARSRGGQARDAEGPRGLARPAARHHRSARRQGS